MRGIPRGDYLIPQKSSSFWDLARFGRGGGLTVNMGLSYSISLEQLELQKEKLKIVNPPTAKK